jgi:hypothetical protein
MSARRAVLGCALIRSSLCYGFGRRLACIFYGNGGLLPAFLGVVVKTSDGTEHTINWTTVKGVDASGKAVAAGSVDTYDGLKDGRRKDRRSAEISRRAPPWIPTLPEHGKSADRR